MKLYRIFPILVLIFSFALPNFAVAAQDPYLIPTQDLPLVALYQSNAPSAVAVFQAVENLGEKGIGISGSGFFVSTNLVMTNKHVVVESTEDGKNLQPKDLNIVTYDKKIIPVQKVYLDPLYDIALLDVGKQAYPSVNIFETKDIKIGQEVFSIANFHNYEFSLVEGHISSQSRQLIAGTSNGSMSYNLEKLLQLNMPTHFGNSGGPLFDMQGRLIGMVTAREGNTETLGFAIPGELLQTSLKKVLQYGEIQYPFLGVYHKNIDWKTKYTYDLKLDNGAYIYAAPGKSPIFPGSPAAQTELKEGDIIVKVNGTLVDEYNTLKTLIAQYMPGDTLTLSVFRAGRILEKSIKLANTKDFKS